MKKYLAAILFVFSFLLALPAMAALVWPMGLVYTHFFKDASINHYWQMEGNSNDSVGSSNGTDTNVTYSTANGLFNQGGKNTVGGVVQLPAYIPFNTSTGSPWSVTGWYNTSTTTTADQDLFGIRGARNTFGIGFKNYTGATTGHLAIQDWQVGHGVQDTATTNDGLWHMFAATFANGSSTQLYVDGVSKVSTTTMTFTTINVKNSIGNFDSNFGRPYDGKYDDIATFSRVLTPAEILQMYQYKRRIFEGVGR